MQKRNVQAGVWLFPVAVLELKVVSVQLSYATCNLIIRTGSRALPFCILTPWMKKKLTHKIEDG